MQDEDKQRMQRAEASLRNYISMKNYLDKKKKKDSLAQHEKPQIVSLKDIAGKLAE